MANLAPELTRRAKPESVEELLAWATEPLATVEVIAITQLNPASRARRAEPRGEADPRRGRFLWTL